MYNPYQKYKEQSILTLTPMESVLKLFDQTVKQIKLAQNAIEGKDFFAANKCIVKAEDIITALRLNLDDRYSISKELDQLYTHIHNSLITANMHKDAGLLGEVLDIVTDLRDTFTQASRIAKNQ